MGDTDRCCRECASSFKGICHLRRDCECHRERAALGRDEGGNPPHRDPVGEGVVNRIIGKQRQQKKRKER